jgi:segregation and condensation protein A
MQPIVQEEEYRLRLGVFEGPLDLLLYLVKKDELDIADIPIEKVAKQYVEYLEAMKELDLDVAGEFLVMAATLMLIKSRMLLPAEERAEEEAEEEDPRWELVRQLVEYKKFKDTALALEGMEERREGIFGREGVEATLGPDDGLALKDVGLFDLVRAFGAALKKAEAGGLREIFADRWTVAEKMEALEERLRKRRRFTLSSVLQGMASRQEIVCVFLALLEMIRLRRVRAVQRETHGEIELERREAGEEEEGTEGMETRQDAASPEEGEKRVKRGRTARAPGEKQDEKNAEAGGERV